jgi:5-methylcytosine-specific restriction endonuclease McrA
MKLELTPQRLNANRANGLLGGLARQTIQKGKYKENPSFCAQCLVNLPQEKKNNKFCSRSCSATFNNTAAPKRIAKLYKCVVCETEFKNKSKYCSNKCFDFGRRKYKTKEEQAEAIRKKVREVSAHYRASVRNQTPPDADRKAIKEFYDNCPEGYEVDHIIPISKNGMHTLSNLQYLTIRENRQKSNKLPSL